MTKRPIDTCNSLLTKDYHNDFSRSQCQPIVIAVTEVLKHSHLHSRLEGLPRLEGSGPLLTYN